MFESSKYEETNAISVKPKEVGVSRVCNCCGLPKAIYMDAPSAQQVCDPCKAHHSRDLQKIIILHRDWYVEYTREVAARYQDVVSNLRQKGAADEERIAELESKIKDLREVIDRDYNDAPLGPLRTWVQSQAVVAAESRMSRAYRSRDTVMAGIWRLDQLHKDGKNQDTCACTKPAARCRDRAALTPLLKALTTWEDREFERLKVGKDHGLPNDHPEVMKRAHRGYSSAFRR